MKYCFMSQNRWGINSYCMDTNKNYENSQYFRMKGFFFLVTLTECSLNLCISGFILKIGQDVVNVHGGSFPVED